jgi:hypothetical protein
MDAGAVATGSDGAYEGVDPRQLGDQLGGERCICRHVVGVVVLIGAPCFGQSLHQLAYADPTGLLPATVRVRRVHDVQSCAVGGEQSA